MIEKIFKIWVLLLFLFALYSVIKVAEESVKKKDEAVRFRQKVEQEYNTPDKRTKTSTQASTSP